MNDSILRFDAEKAKAACSDILTALKEPENAERLKLAKDAAGSDMVKVMREVFPLVTQIQLEVIPKYGFSCDGDGAAQFLQLIRSLEKEDEEVGQLGDQVRAYFLPFMTAPVPSISTNASE